MAVAINHKGIVFIDASANASILEKQLVCQSTTLQAV